LSPLAVETIKTIKPIAGCDFVFSTTGTTAFSGFSNFKEKLDRKIEELKKAHPPKYARQFAEPWTFHDLRRTVKTGLADLGVASDVRDLLLNHTLQGMNKVYDHSQRADEKRKALELWEAHIMGLVRMDEGQGKKERRSPKPISAQRTRRASLSMRGVGRQ
jgi:integrase